MSALEQALRDARHCAPVLDRMLRILANEPEVSFGDALARARAELNIEISDNMELVLLRTAEKIVSDRARAN